MPRRLAAVDWLDTLNPQQRLAVTTTDGPLLIVAGPGSGKTRVIVHRIAYLVQAHGVAPWNILAVTFTNKAAREMRDRLDSLMTERQIRALTVGTFHSTCARWLRIDGERIGIDRRFTIYDDGDQLDLVKRALNDLELDEKQHRPRSVLAAISGAKNESVSPERFEQTAEGYGQQIIARAYRRYQELLDENRGLDFDDLLGKTLELFVTAPDVLEQYQDRFPYLMVDEFQDTNVVQYELVRLLGKKHRNVCIVGDEDQSIYGWRKADVRNLQHFERDFPELKIVLLEQNYRSTQAVLDVASAVISPNEGRKAKRLWTENSRGLPVQLHEAYDERDEALYVVRQIEAMRREGSRYGDVAVAYRTNAQSRALEEAFIRYDVPYRLVGGTAFYQRREVKDVIAYLRLLGNQSDGLSFQRIVNVPARGIGQKTVSDLSLWASRLGLPEYEAAKLAAAGTEEIGADGRIAPVVPMATRPRAMIGKFVDAIEGAQERLGEATLSEAIEALLERIDYRGHVADGSSESEDRWRNVQELVTKLHDYDNMDGNAGLRAFLDEAALVQAADSLADADAGAVTLITLHAAKGLEFPIVFLVGLEDGIAPHSRAIGENGTLEELQEERRLLYVGVTRAEQRLFLVYAANRTLYGELREQVRSMFLDDIPADLLSASFSQVAGGSRTTERRLPGRDPWGRGSSSGYGSRRESGYGSRRDDNWRSQPPAAFRPSNMPGRGSPPPASSLGNGRPAQWRPARDPYADLDVGVGADADSSSGSSLDLGLNDGPATPRERQQPLFTPARASKAANPSREPRFGKGQRVRHPEYGLGTVVVASFAGSEELVLVKFDSRPDKPKNLSLAIHRLDPA
ncbi:MAG: UvrD-helicase domain-containing protein [Chloroflexota bacterium]